LDFCEEKIKMKKRYLFTIALLLILTIVYSQRASIAKRIMAKGIEAAMSTDTLTDLGEGLHVALCGAGGPLPDPKRSGACVAVVAGGKIFVVDAGTNGARNLNAMRFPIGEVSRVFLTHFHSDHIDGLGELATLRWVSAGHTDKLIVIGPAGVKRVTDGFNDAYSQDSVYRHDHHGESVAPLSGHGMIAVEYPLPADGEITTVYDEEGLRVNVGSRPRSRESRGSLFIQLPGSQLAGVGGYRQVSQSAAVCRGCGFIDSRSAGP